jgi:hypothetical protein
MPHSTSHGAATCQRFAHVSTIFRSPPAADDLVQPVQRHAHTPGRLDLRQPGGAQELLEQHLARRRGRPLQVQD